MREHAAEQAALFRIGADDEPDSRRTLTCRTAKAVDR
jgi:hypothetical protein